MDPFFIMILTCTDEDTLVNFFLNDASSTAHHLSQLSRPVLADVHWHVDQHGGQQHDLALLDDLRERELGRAHDLSGKSHDSKLCIWTSGFLLSGTRD